MLTGKLGAALRHQPPGAIFPSNDKAARRTVEKDEAQQIRRCAGEPCAEKMFYLRVPAAHVPATIQNIGGRGHSLHPDWQTCKPNFAAPNLACRVRVPVFQGDSLRVSLRTTHPRPGALVLSRRCLPALPPRTDTYRSTIITP